MSLTVSIEIDAPPDSVWAAIEPIERHVDWMADAVEIRFHTEQRHGAGTSFTCVTRVGPLRLDDRMTITGWEPGERMGVRHDGVVSGIGAFTLTPIDRGRRTRFTWREELTFPWYLGGPIGRRLAPAVLRPLWRRNLRRLRHLVEPRGSPAR